MTVRAYDIVIVGAGPAGSAALELAARAPARARRTLLLDRAVFPRPKLCGGGVTLRADALLDRIAGHLAVPSLPIHQVRHLLPAQSITLPWRDNPPYFRIVDRAEFDQALLEAARRAGVEVREGEAVIDLLPAAAGVVVRTARDDYRATVVIGADGANSVVRRKLGLSRADRLSRLVEILTPVDPERTPEFAGHLAVFDFRPVAAGVDGYYWDFPTFRQGAPMMNRGLFDSRVRPRQSAPALKPIFAASLAHRGVELGQFALHGHPERWFDPTAAHSAPHVILAGDAAGAEPLMGEGISSALAGGILAAESAADAFARSDFSFADYEQRLRASELGRWLCTKWFAARAFYGSAAKLDSLIGW